MFINFLGMNIHNSKLIRASIEMLFLGQVYLLRRAPLCLPSQRQNSGARRLAFAGAGTDNLRVFWDKDVKAVAGARCCKGITSP
jgi:hypothetical protein